MRFLWIFPRSRLFLRQPRFCSIQCAEIRSARSITSYIHNWLLNICSCLSHSRSDPLLTFSRTQFSLWQWEIWVQYFSSGACIVLDSCSLELTIHKLFQFTDDLGVQLVIVNIADENDNGPLFTKKLYTGGNLFFFFTAKFVWRFSFKKCKKTVVA